MSFLSDPPQKYVENAGNADTVDGNDAVDLKNPVVASGSVTLAGGDSTEIQLFGTATDPVLPDSFPPMFAFCNGGWGDVYMGQHAYLKWSQYSGDSGKQSLFIENNNASYSGTFHYKVQEMI